MNKQKEHFKQKLEAVQKTIWDVEFKREKTKMIREEIRVEYDITKSKLEVLNIKIKSEKEKPTMPEGDIARLDDEKIRIENDLKRYEGQMKDLDIEINGCKPNQDYQEGVVGINQQLESLRELLIMIKDYIKKIKDFWEI